MAKQHFFLRLIPPRATFPGDMTENERALMLQHVSYFQRQFSEGRVLIYGPVLAQTNAFGMGVVEVEDEAELRSMMDADPSVAGGLNRYEVTPMKVGAARGL